MKLAYVYMHAKGTPRVYHVDALVPNICPQTPLPQQSQSNMLPMPLVGKVALITGEAVVCLFPTILRYQRLSPCLISVFCTGGASGLGKHLADALHSEGVTLIIADINKAFGVEVTDDFNKLREG